MKGLSLLEFTRNIGGCRRRTITLLPSRRLDRCLAEPFGRPAPYRGVHLLNDFVSSLPKNTVIDLLAKKTFAGKGSRGRSGVCTNHIIVD